MRKETIPQADDTAYRDYPLSIVEKVNEPQAECVGKTLHRSSASLLAK